MTNMKETKKATKRNKIMKMSLWCNRSHNQKEDVIVVTKLATNCHSVIKNKLQKYEWAINKIQLAQTKIETDHASNASTGNPSATIAEQ